MSTNIQIYYLLPQNLKKYIDRMGIDLDISVREGNLTIVNLKNEIKNQPDFCRNEESISFTHFLSLLYSDIILYAVIEEKIVGALSFMFIEKNDDKIINFNGICSPIKYSGLGVGQELINTLIRIGKNNDIKYISLECNENMVKYYRDKFGFTVESTKMIYDSDDSDNEDGDSYYNMILDLSTVSGGRKIKRKNKKSIKKQIKKRSRRTRRKLRK